MTTKSEMICMIDAPEQWEMRRRVYSTDGIAPTVTSGGRGHAPKILVEDMI